MRPYTRFCLILLTIGSLLPGVGCEETKKQRLSVTVEGGGSVGSDPAGIDCGQDCRHDFSSVAQVTLTATPEAGYELESWGGDCSGSASTCQLALSRDRVVTATFAESGNEDPCEGVSCSGHGSCEDGTCNCGVGYAGDDCSSCADGYVPSGDDCTAESGPNLLWCTYPTTRADGNNADGMGATKAFNYIYTSATNPLDGDTLGRWSSAQTILFAQNIALWNSDDGFMERSIIDAGYN